MWSIFGTTSEPRTGPIGSLSQKSKAAVYESGIEGWCPYCLMEGKRTWVDYLKCPHCKKTLQVKELVMD